MRPDFFGGSFSSVWVNTDTLAYGSKLPGQTGEVAEFLAVYLALIKLEATNR